ncbi:MAG: RND family efflux transporter MFP subunit [Yoonia sp.]|jgi:RND family efflux transporter MFP subunit
MIAEGTVLGLTQQPSAPTAATFAGLRDSRSMDAAAPGWTAAMASALDGAGMPAACVCVFLPDPASGRLHVAGTWPTERRAGTTLIAAAENAMGEKQAVLKPAAGVNKLSAIALPLVVDGATVGVVGVERLGKEPAELRAMLFQMQWGAAWMRDLARQAASITAQGKYARAVEALNAIVVVAERRGFVTAATAAVTDLATRFDCDRVAIGFRRFKTTKIRAVSHSAQFSQRMSLMRMAAAAQDEAIDQRATVLWPDADVADVIITHVHERYAQEHGAGHVFTAPLYAMDRFVGALTFERPADKPFSQDDLEMLEAVTTVLAPIIEEKRLNDRWLITKLLAILRDQLVQLLGPGKLKRKLVVIVAALLVVFFWFAKTMDQVASDAIVRGSEQRSVVAPFAGFVAEAPVRAGDLVGTGDLLVRLDDRELQLERLRLVTQRQREQFEYDRAVAERDRSESRIRQNQITQVESQIALIDEELARTTITAPFDGLIIAGDLSQSIGASVSRGEKLFTLAPDGVYRVDISIDERRIADIALGHTGLLRVTALPDRSLPVEITKITPVANHGEGATTFTVEAQLTGDTQGLRPGMEGATRIDISEKRLIAVWVQPIMDWARIAIWKAWPG